MADFTGFYFDNVHSSAYGLVRTSDGSRYTEGLIPEFEDREIELVGGDGSLYEGRRFKKTPFTIEVAFDHMTETQLRDLRKWLGTDELKPFRFDERPYKTYWVKPSRKPELTYVCFMEEDENYEDGTYIGPGSDTHKIRIYKGEGKLEFTAYDPYGYCIDESTLIEGAEWKELPKVNWQNSDSYNDFNEGGTNHINEWGVAVGLKDTFDLQNYNKFLYDSPTLSGRQLETYIGNPDYIGSLDQGGARSGLIADSWSGKLYNPGDFETDFQLHLNLSGAFVYKNGICYGAPITNNLNVQIYIVNNENPLNNPLYTFSFKTKGLTEKDKIILDTKTHALIVYAFIGKDSNGEDMYQKTLRYDLINSTDFPKIPIGESRMIIQRGFDGFNNSGTLMGGIYGYITNTGSFVRSSDAKFEGENLKLSWTEDNETKTQIFTPNEYNPVWKYEGWSSDRPAIIELTNTKESVCKNSAHAYILGGLINPNIKYNYKFY